MWSASHAKGVPKNAQRCGRTPGCIPPISNFEGAVGFGKALLLKPSCGASRSLRCVARLGEGVTRNPPRWSTLTARTCPKVGSPASVTLSNTLTLTL